MQIPYLPEEKLLKILTNLVQIQTINPPGKTNEAVDYLIENVLTKEQGFKNTILTHEKDGVELHNLVSEIGSGKDRIILCGHLDVVPVGDENQWTYPPFSAKIVDGKLYGRGSADMKSGLTALIGIMLMLKTIPKFLEKHTLVLMATADEEAGMTGAQFLEEQGLMKGAILLLVTEPTELTIGVAEKGVLWAKVEVEGKAAHGSLPQEGLNAIEAVTSLFPEFYSLVSEEKNEFLGTSTLNIATLHGGTKINVVPDYAVLELDYRLIPEQSSQELIKKLLAVKHATCPVKITITQNTPSIENSKDHQFIQNLQKISNKPIVGLTYGTDAAKLVKPANPIPFVIFGPGSAKVIHKIDEYVPIKEMYQTTEYLVQALLETYL